MVKDVDGYVLTRFINRNFTFFSAKNIDKEDYIKPTKQDINPDFCILCVEINYLLLDDKLEVISNCIIDTSKLFALEKAGVIISNIVRITYTLHIYIYIYRKRTQLAKR